jgi:hypothetical protein
MQLTSTIILSLLLTACGGEPEDDPECRREVTSIGGTPITGPQVHPLDLVPCEQAIADCTTDSECEGVADSPNEDAQEDEREAS